MNLLMRQLGMGARIVQPLFAAKTLRVVAPFCGAPFENRHCCRRHFLPNRPPAPCRDVQERSGGSRAHPF